MIQQRGTRWRVVVQAGRDPITGKRHQLSGTAATEREAVALERKLRLQAEAGVNGRILLRDLVAEWWESGPRLSPTTEVNYRGNLDKHILPVLGAKRADEIRPRLVAQFVRHVQGEGLSAATARKVRTVLSAVMSYAVAMEYVESNPVMKVPPPELDGEERPAPTVEEAAKLLLHAERTDAEFLTYLWVAAEEGGRRGETLALRWSGVDFEHSTVTIDSVVSIGPDGVQARRRTKSKKPRTIAVSSITLEYLREHKRTVEALMLAATGEPSVVSPDGFVFSGGTGSRRSPLDGKPWRPDSTSRRYARLKKAAGVRPEIDLHGLRRTMVTELLAAGVDPRTVMGRAGHSSEAMTMTVYAKVRPAVDAAAADLWGSMLQAKLHELRAATPPDNGGSDAESEHDEDGRDDDRRLSA